ncbi:DegT/DnrJ/EryC1/StrS family aminotransferase, partial [Thermodesulfobacteriota bacterium]
MQVKFFDLKEQNDAVKDEVMADISSIIDLNQFVFGPKLDGFEKEIAEWCGVEHALSLSSGTDAILIALMALDIKPGDEIITTPFTFFATAGSIARAGGTPVFVDIDKDTFNINPADIEKKITDKTKAIMPVHLYGQ